MARTPHRRLILDMDSAESPFLRWEMVLSARFTGLENLLTAVLEGVNLFYWQ